MTIIGGAMVAPADLCYVAPGARSGPPGGKNSAGASQLEGLRLERVGHADAQEPDLGLKGDAHARFHPLAGHFHETENIRVGRPAAVDDQVARLGRDLCPAHALAAEAHGLDETGGAVPRRVLPDVAGRREGGRR